VSVVVVEDGGPTVRCVNHCGPIRDLLEA
jgi:hypothetical protein